MKNYWVVVGVMAGFCQGGGVEQTTAEWMIEGEPGIDVCNDEAILAQGEAVGYVPSGGYAQLISTPFPHSSH